MANKTIITLYRTDNINRLFADIKRQPRMTEQKEREAFKALRDGDETMREKIANANLLFVIERAKLFDNADKFADYVSEGTKGLMRAIDSFEYEKGFKFITYAVHYINRALVEFARGDKMVKASNDKLIGSKLNHIINRFFAENGREPSEDEIIEILEKKHDIKVKNSKDVVLCKMSRLSDVVGGDDSDDTMETSGEFAMSTASHNGFEDEVEREDIAHKVKNFMQMLDTKEFQVITMAFGLDGHGERQDAEIAEIMDLSNERIRQIRLKAIEKMNAKAVRLFGARKVK